MGVGLLKGLSGVGSVASSSAAVAVVPRAQRLGASFGDSIQRRSLHVGATLLFIACTFTYYGQLNRTQTGDSYGTIYTSVAIVQGHTIWLDRYLPYLQQHAGQNPYMLRQEPGGHVVNLTPTASSVLAVPVVALFSALGVSAANWGAWMEAAMLTAALSAAAAVALMFKLLTRLTTRRRAALLAATFAWGTLQWGVSGQALWQHGGAVLALTGALLALVDRRMVLAGVAVCAMVAFRPNTVVIAVFLLPLVGRRLGDWARLVLGFVPFALPLALYNTVAFGSPFHQGYGTAHILGMVQLQRSRLIDGIPGLLVAPGRGLFVYAPVLLFALVGAARGLRRPLYRWSALAVIAYVVVEGNDSNWWGGQSFGARKLTEIIPFLVLLLVPALEGIRRRRWWILYGVLLAYSVLVELLAAATPYAATWLDTHPYNSDQSVWWHPTDNELLTMLTASGVAVHLLEMAALLVGSILLGYVATTTLPGLSRAAAE